MNINNMKGILGDAVSNEVRTLELKVGQVVRGVVLQQFPNNEATVSINGVQVRAKLEIPLMEGQASLLQVQPDSKGGQVHLKQVDPASLGLQDPMKDILKALNMPDKDWAQELVKELRREGFALNKETAAAFQRAAQLQPPGVSQEQWMNAAAAVFKRGLPMTEATISAMHQLQSGNPLHSLIGQLRGQLLQMLQNNSHPQLQQLLTAAAVQLEQGADLLRLLAGTTTASSGQASIQGGQAAAQYGQPLLQTQSGQTQMIPLTGLQPAPNPAIATAAANLQQGGLPAAAAFLAQEGVQSSTFASLSQASLAQGGQTTASQSQLLPQLMKWLGVNYESLFAKQILSPSSSGSTSAAQTSQSSSNQLSQSAQLFSVLSNAAANGSAPAAGSTQQTVQMSNQQAQLSQTIPTAGMQQAQPQTASQVGAHATQLTNNGQTDTATTTTHQNVQNATSNQVASNSNAANHPANAAAQPFAATLSGTQTVPQINNASATLQHAAQQQAAEAFHISPSMQSANGQPVQDSLKALMMQLLQAAEMPSSIKESAGQILHAITGQQLMLSAERNHSVFSHVTLYIPIQDDENGQTAAVHVQTRRNRKGELDSDNCRIVFDLQMKNLGPTLVDMNIVNKIVSLNLWNDHPAISPIVEALKPDIIEALQQYGYVLSSVRATPIPLEDKVPTKQEEGKAVILPPDIEQLNSARYKGVDFKI